VQIGDSKKAKLVRAVFTLLSVGNHDGAKAYIDLSMSRIKTFEECNQAKTIEVIDGEDVRRISIGSPEYEAWLRAFDRLKAALGYFRKADECFRQPKIACRSLKSLSKQCTDRSKSQAESDRQGARSVPNQISTDKTAVSPVGCTPGFSALDCAPTD